MRRMGRARGFARLRFLPRVLVRKTISRLGGEQRKDFARPERALDANSSSDRRKHHMFQARRNDLRHEQDLPL